MRQFERDDELRAAAGDVDVDVDVDVDAQLRLQRRKDVLSWNSNKRRTALRIAPPPPVVGRPRGY